MAPLDSWKMSATTLDHDGPLERYPAPRVKAMVSRWNYRRNMEEVVRRHTTDTNAAMAPIDHIQGLLHGDMN